MFFELVNGKLDSVGQNEKSERHKPVFEPLENRLLLTSYVVDTTVDESDGDYSAGDLSLREAIELANADATEDTITFSTVAFDGGGTIALEQGELLVTEDLKVSGLSGDTVVLNGQGSSRIFKVDGIGELAFELSHLTLFNGYDRGNGGAVFLDTVNARFEDTVVSSSIAGNMGGGIFGRYASITVIESDVSNNRAGDNGGGIGGDDISVLLQDSLLSDNGTAGDGGGVGLACCSGPIVIQNSIVTGNEAGGTGGALSGYDADILISNSTISHNSADSRGGGIYIVNEGSYLITGSTINDNQSEDHGGGIYIWNASVDIFNSTISGNTSFKDGGGIYSGFSPELVLVNSTITGNESARGGGLYRYEDAYSGYYVKVFNSILAGNVARLDATHEVSGLIAQGTHNVIGDAGSSGTLLNGVDGNVVGFADVSTILNPILLDVGGPTKVHVLSADSPAINAGDNAISTSYTLLSDQLGADRFAGGVTDIGAFESGGTAVPIQLKVSNLDIIENSPVGTHVGVVSVVSPEVDRAYTYQLLDDADGALVLDEDSGELTVADDSLLDYEVNSTLPIIIRVTDDLGESSTRNFVVVVQDVDEVDVEIRFSGSDIATYSRSGDRLGSFSANIYRAGPYTYTLIDNADGLFYINDHYYLEVGDTSRIGTAGTIHEFTVRATNNETFYDQTFSVPVTSGSPPTDLYLSRDNMDEYPSTYRAGITVYVEDVDNRPPDSFTFRLLDDADGRFTIGNYLHTTNGALGRTPLLDYETGASHDITIEVTDAAGYTYVEDFTIYVNDIDDAPREISIDNTWISEDIANGAFVANVTVTDMDVIDYTFSLADDGLGTWAIDPVTGVLTIADNSLIDNENDSRNVPNPTVRVEDGTGWELTRFFGMSVSDVNEPPTDLYMIGTEIREGDPASTIIGTVLVVDEDREWADSHVFELLDDASGRFILGETSGVLSLGDQTLIDYETATNHQVRIKVTDEAGHSYQEDFLIEVLDLVTGPTDLHLLHSRLPESASNGDVVGDVIALHETGVYGGSHSFVFLNDAEGRFEIDGNSGEISVKDSSRIDHELFDHHEVTVRVNGENGSSYDESFDIEILDVNEAPFNLQMGGVNILRHTVQGALLGVFSADDPEGDSIIYELVNDSQGLYSLDGATGELRLNRSLSSPPDFLEVAVRASDQEGLFVSEVFQIPVAYSDGVFFRHRLPARVIQSNAFKGSLSARLINSSSRDFTQPEHMSISLIGRSLSDGLHHTLATQNFRGRWSQGKAKTLNFNFTGQLPEGDYQVFVMAAYDAPGQELIQLRAMVDSFGELVFISSDREAHIDLTTETELTSKLPASHPEGERLKLKLKVHVLNDGNSEMPAAVTNLQIFLIDSLGVRQGGPIATVDNLKLSKLKPGQIKTVNVSFDMPAGTPPGEFRFQSEIDVVNRISESNVDGTGESNNTSFTAETIVIEDPYVDLASQLGDQKGNRNYIAGKVIRDTRTLRISQRGNVATAKSALANLRIEIFDTRDRLVDTQLIKNVKLGNLQPGRSKNVAARMSLSPLAVGIYKTVYTLEPVNFTDTDLSDNAFELAFRVR